MTLEHLKQQLAQFGLRPDKKFGQNFLMDDLVLDAMVEAAQLTTGDVVLEVGPGVGNLTAKLLAAGPRLLSVEKDGRLSGLLANLQKKHGESFELVFADIMRYDFVSALERLSATRPLSYCVVANIPYYVTGKLIQLLLEARVKPTSITVLVQKEVAENMTARPGAMNLLGLSVQLEGRARLVMNVPAQSFYPAPKVDSAVVHVDIFRQSPFEPYDKKAVFRVARACFAGKRKQIHNSLAAGLRLPSEAVAIILARVGIAETTRPQELSVEQFIALSRVVEQGVVY